MVFEAARLQLHSMAYSREDEYKGRHLIKKRSSKHKEGQQRCSITQGRIMVKKNNSRSNHVEENNNNK